MGDMADFVNDCDIDVVLYETMPKQYVCAFCGEDGLIWRKIGERWRLVEIKNGRYFIHYCDGYFKRLDGLNRKLKFKIGDRIKVSSGLFSGTTGIIRDIKRPRAGKVFYVIRVDFECRHICGNYIEQKAINLERLSGDD